VTAPEFSFAYLEPTTPPAKPLPEPWNTTYLDAWFTFLQSVAARYGNNPEFRMIATDGPTSVSGEMSLPYHTSGDTALPATYNGKAIMGNDINMWEALGYTPDLYEGAWQTTFSEFHQLFPNQYLSLALIPGLPIGNQASGSVDSISPPDPSQTTATPLDIIATGLKYKPGFVLQDNGLAGKVTNDGDAEYNFVKANCGNIPTGFQTKAPSQVAKEGTLNSALEKGVAAGVDFLEVYESDLGDEKALENAAKGLQHNRRCVPLRLIATPPEGSVGTAANVTATTDLNLSSGDTVNVFEGTKLLNSCSSITCKASLDPGIGTTLLTAEVSYAGQIPIVSASTTLSRSAPVTKGTLPKPCTGTACSAR
jgi:hypothetical protein